MIEFFRNLETEAGPKDNPIAANSNAGNPGKKRTIGQKWRLVSLNNKLIVVFSGMTMLATVVYSIVAGWTLREIHTGAADTHTLAEAAKKQADKTNTISQSIAQAVVELTASADAAGQQSKALQNQVTILRSNFAKEQRPIVIAWSVKPYLKTDSKISADIFWANYGKTVALRCNGRGTIFYGKNALNSAYDWFQGEATLPYPRDFSGVVIRPGIPTSESDPSGHRSTLLSNAVISKIDLDWIMANDFSAVIVSRQDYFDQLGNHYWTEGCWSHFASGAIPQCPKHNEVH